jgi:hypothetical protein
MPQPLANLSPEHTVLLAVGLLIVKHAIADFILQTTWQREQKAIYGALGGLLHASIHVVLTAPILLLELQLPWNSVAMLLAAEFVVHYHIDWAKEQVVRRAGWGWDDTAFWWAFGLDQMMHGLTYVGLLWAAYAM